MGRRLKILSLCTRYLPMRAGADNMMHQVHRELIRLGHDVCVLAINNDENSWPEEETIDDVLIWRRAKDYGYELTADAVKRYQPDLLFGQFGLLPYGVERAVELNLPIVVWCHTHHGFDEPKKSALVEMVDLFVFNSAYLYEEAGVNVRHVTVNPPLEKERVLATDHRPECVTLINLCAAKGPKIFYHLARQFPEQKFLGVEGGYEDQVKRDRANVEYVPHGADIASVYARTKVLVVPSVLESFGMAAVEAQLNGIPVIASDLTSLRDALGKGALYVKRTDRAGWVKALRTLLVQRDYYDRIADRARANVQRFNFTRDMRECEIVLRQLVAERDKRQRPSIHRLGAEYAAANEAALQAYRDAGHEPTDAEVAKIVESAYRPDEYVKALKSADNAARA